MKEIKTLTGVILVEASESANEFNKKFGQFNSDYQWANRQISKRCKKIEKASKTIAQEFFGLSSELAYLSKMVNENIEIP